MGDHANDAALFAGLPVAGVNFRAATAGRVVMSSETFVAGSLQDV
jgi:hypothetical protein